MIYKNFRVNLIARVLILVLTILLLIYLLGIEYYVSSVFLSGIFVYQVISLIRYVDRTNRDLASFIESIRFSEFSRSYEGKGLGASFEGLYQAFNDVIKDFQRVRAEKEEHYHYLQNIVQNVDVSIMVYLRNGEIEMINKAAKKLFQVTSLKNINQLERLSSDLVSTLLSMKPGKSELVKVQDEDDLLYLSVFTTEMKINDKVIILASINNIQNVLEEQETEAWQKLIRVLTHEIMNSITPIASLSSTLEIMVQDIVSGDEVTGIENYKKLDNEILHEIQQALQTINKRSTGLLHFVNTYRNLTRIPKPNFKITRVKSIFKNLEVLFEESIQKHSIELKVVIQPENIEINADEQLIEQVLINLMNNSIYALEGIDNPRIELRALYNKRGRVNLQVVDNGQGILKDVLDKIFIPFFTTKQSGSGIGLSLSRQILRLHNGTITVYSEPEVETVFTLTF